MLVFEKGKEYERKVILSTNIAETSITVTEVMFIIDSGFCKIREFHSDRGFESLISQPISQSQA